MDRPRNSREDGSPMFGQHAEPHHEGIDPAIWVPDPLSAEDPVRGGTDLALIWPLLGRHIAFHRRLVDLTDSVKAALLLSQSIYWTRHGRDVEANGGWFHKTAEQWTLETGLSVKEQQTAREQLRALSLLQDQRVGLPARLHYRLNLDELGTRLQAHLMSFGGGLTTTPIDWDDRLVLAELLGPAVAFHRTLAALAGGVHGGLLLSRALHLMRLQSRRRLALWVEGSEARWQQDLGLTRRTQEAARRDLLGLGLWEERLDGMPPVVWARVRLESLHARLFDAGERSSAESGFPTSRLAPKGESRMWESLDPVLPKPPTLIDRKRRHCFAESAAPYKENTTGVSLQPPGAMPVTSPAVDRAAQKQDLSQGGVGVSLVFAEQLLPAEREVALRLLTDSPIPPQLLLDELAGRMQAGAVRSPLAYLRGLVQRAHTGTFVPELAVRVAAERQRLSQVEDSGRRKARQAMERSALQSSPEYRARVQAGIDQARALLAEMKRDASTAAIGQGLRPSTGFPHQNLSKE
jgi:hypothetical protein